MRVRKLEIETPCKNNLIPSSNILRSIRFYRELFDLNTQFDLNENRHIFFKDTELEFSNNISLPITLNVIVRDHQEDVKNHLLNYYVKQYTDQSISNNMVVFHILDFDNNKINIFCNK